MAFRSLTTILTVLFRAKSRSKLATKKDGIDLIMITFLHSPLIELVKTPGRKKAALKKANHLQHANYTSLDSTSSMDTFHSVPLSSPGDHIRKIETLPQTCEVLPIENNSQIPTTPVEIFSQTNEVLPIENNNQVPTTPVETFHQTSEVLPIESNNHVPTTLASQLLYDRDRVLTDIQEEDVEMSVKLIEKPIPPPSFPTLPEPMPLRKSTKPPRDPSINAVLLGAATPGAPVGGMRTSWLMKAREANLDKLSKKSHPPGMGSEVGASSSLTFQGTKRKSDHFSLPQVGIRDDERPHKLAKTSEGETRKSDPFSLPPIGIRDDERPLKLAKTSEGETRESNPFSLPPIGIRDDERPPKPAKTSEGEIRKSDPFSLPPIGIRDDERPPKLAKTSEGETRENDPLSLPPIGIRDDEQPPKLAKTSEGETRKSDHFSLPPVGIRDDDERPPKLAKTLESETESQSQLPAIVESASEGVFDRLKKVVEDLGIRVGK